MKKLRSFGLILFIAFIVGLAIYNIITNQKSFFTFPIKDLITVLMAIIVSYYLSHKKNDKRKLKEEADDVVEKIQKITIILRDCDIMDAEMQPKILVLIKNIKSKFMILDAVADKVGIAEEIAYCLDKLEKYEKLLASEPTNRQGLLALQAKAYDYLSDIDNHLDEVQIKLYQ